MLKRRCRAPAKSMKGADRQNNQITDVMLTNGTLDQTVNMSVVNLSADMRRSRIVLYVPVHPDDMSDRNVF